MTRFQFMGTGGGRFATIFQTRGTGGIYLEDGVRIHIDPGPGALVRLKEHNIDPMKLDAVLVSHSHPDHYTDADILVEGMTKGCRESRGLLAGSKSVILGAEGHHPIISAYHLDKPKKVISLVPNQTFYVRKMKVEATPADHTDLTAIGFKFFTRGGVISYTGDTRLNDDVVKAHAGCRIFIASVTRPLGGRIPNHLCTEDAAILIGKVKPEVAFLTHMGLKVIEHGPEEQADWIEQRTGVRTIAAKDNMLVDVGDEVRVE